MSHLPELEKVQRMPPTARCCGPNESGMSAKLTSGLDAPVSLRLRLAERVAVWFGDQLEWRAED
jgi:hypothetical protein